ncbi:MAG: CHAP domain-containing protein, partial [Sphingobium sp.]|nr:CHAP domain-containing protein [Sphingobium sp.]
NWQRQRFISPPLPNRRQNARLIEVPNWSSPGAIEEDVRAVDVSEDGDWSAVRVWHTPTGQMGARINPTYGFIYGEKARLRPFTGIGGTRLTQTARFAIEGDGSDEPALTRKAAPRLAYADVTRTDDVRTLTDIIRDVKRLAKLK